jgi:hypothetical protein
MQIDLRLEGLTKAELVRLTNLFEALTESRRSKAFNGFLFWAAREIEREIRGRRLRVPLRHALNIEVQRMRPGEVLFLQRQLQQWEAEFGEHVMGQAAEFFWQASAGLWAVSRGTLLLN